VQGPGGQRRGRSRSSSLPVIGSGLIEVELRDGLRSGEIEGRGLVEVEACWRLLAVGAGPDHRGHHPGLCGNRRAGALEPV